VTGAPLPHADLLMRDHAWLLLDAVGAIVVVLRPDGCVESCNAALAHVTGYTVDELQGRSWFDLFIPKDLHEGKRASFAGILDGKPLVGILNQLVNRDGQVRTFECIANVVRDPGGKPIGVIAIGLDVTDKLELLTKLVQSERLAAIGTLAAIFAHEVGNPLNAMYLQAQLLRRRIDRPLADVPLGPKIDAMIGEIQRLNSLLDDFRSFQRPERPRFEPTDLGAVIRHVLDIIDARAELSKIVLESDIAPELPRVQGNANKLEQVLHNLCKNAMEAMPDGGTLRLAGRRVDDHVELDVCDTGRGIPTGLDVFEPFSTSKPAGMGLGLALVREIVGLHGGQIRYASSDAGTTFTLELPVDLELGSGHA
jgi:PAS domain S-box-containing protein